MAYHPLTLPPGLPVDVEGLVRRQIECQLIDVHSMLRLPVVGDPGLQGGCNFAIVQVLLSVVAGASVTLYDPTALSRRGDRGRLFMDILIKHYPWGAERSISGAVVDADAAGKLYVLLRNPLAHSVGVIDPAESGGFKRVVVLKGPFAEDVIESTERARVRPADWADPTLRQDGADLVLWVRSFYWGVRRMIEDVANARAQPAGVNLLPPSLAHLFQAST